MSEGSLLRRRPFLRQVVAYGAVITLLQSCTPSPLVAAPKTFKLVFLFTRLSEPVVQSNMSNTRQGLQDLGYIEGRNITYSGLDAASETTRFPALAAEAVALAPDIVICQNVLAALELKAATSTIPIVFVQINADPLEFGVVTSLSRPGGNITGIGVAGAALAAKRLELLKEAAPSVTRVAVIQEESRPRHELSAMETAAVSLGISIFPIFIRSAADLDSALDAAVVARAEALFHTAGFVTGTQTNAKKIADFAIRRRWPTVNIAADLGGLINYNGVLNDPWRRAATYVDRIFKGTKPGDIPVEGPTGSSLVINMCTAARLGLTIPQSVLAQANTLVGCPGP